MKFLDTAKIFVKSGNGGDGCIGFRRERNVAFGGPNGGDGGRGGDVIFKANAHMNTLIDYRYQQHFKAGKGEHGRGRDQHGADGQDLILEVPVGTQIFDDDVMLHDLIQDGQKIVLLKGGEGGFGNTHFKSSTNRAPRISSKGEEGKELCLVLRLKLLADFGLVGLPNAGKSTLLSVLTRAHPKIANYPFTTLYPQLGLLAGEEKDHVLADLPGLIEDAHQGKGLGQRFLGHVERCKGIVHVIDAAQEDPMDAYRIIRKELCAYHHDLENKKELIVLNKIDQLEPDACTKLVQDLLEYTGRPVIAISALMKTGLTTLRRELDAFT